jgi:hypothetical protein
MVQRGRKSAELRLLPKIPGQQRPEPPDLPPAESEIWRAVIGAMPAGWFGPECQPLLRCYCSLLATCDVLAARVVAAREETNWKLVDRLTKIHERQTKCATDLAGKLRLTPRSKTSVEMAANMRQVPQPGSRPWDMKR